MVPEGLEEHKAQARDCSANCCIWWLTFSCLSKNEGELIEKISFSDAIDFHADSHWFQNQRYDEPDIIK